MIGPMPTDIPADIAERARRIRLACFDVDGTLTDGRLVYGADGGEAKAFHVHDGQGLSLLRRAGLHVVLVTARGGDIVPRRAAELGIEAHVGVADKRALVAGLRERLGIAADAVAYMGDDVGDTGAMAEAALAVAPADAHASARAAAHWTTRLPGGAGAARELCDLLLLSRGAVDATGAPQ